MSIDTLTDLPLLFASLNLETLEDEQRQKIIAVDACLPQTQCGLCEHPEGCLPYATAIVVNEESHNKCVPGGQPVSDAIAQLLGRPKLTAVPSQWSIDPMTQRPTEVRAVIREADCIGCTKCIPACPVDAIIGTGKHMHTIFTDLCTGCELCLPPCPVDCIDLVVVPSTQRKLSSQQRTDEQQHLKQRYHTHLNRVTAQMIDKRHAKPVTSVVETKIGNATHQSNDASNISEAQAKKTIAAAKLRTKIKKLHKQLSIRPNEAKQLELLDLQNQLDKLQ